MFTLSVWGYMCVTNIKRVYGNVDTGLSHVMRRFSIAHGGQNSLLALHRRLM